DVAHNKPLALSICQGLRPKFNIKVPQLILHLIKRCLDADPLNRQTAKEIEKTLHKWHINLTINPNGRSEFIKQVKEAEKINNNLSTSNIPLTNLTLSYETHPEAIYTSRLLDFNNLSEPKNSDGY